MKRGLAFTAITLFTIWFFVFGIPVDTYANNAGLIAAISTIICTILFVYTIICFFPKDTGKKPDSDDSKDKSGYVIFAVFMLFLFGFGTFQVKHALDAKKNELKENGRLVIATVIDGSSYKTRKVDFTDIKFEFLLEDGSRYTAKADVSAKEFSKYHIGKEVPIVYSKKYPSLIKILRNDEEVSEYSGNTSRNLN